VTVLTLQNDGKTFGSVEIDPKTQALLRKERALEIWKRLVRYVQADLNHKDELQNFGALVEECMAWSGLVGVPEDVVGDKVGLFRTLVAGGRERTTIRNTNPFKLCSDGLTPEEGAIKYQKDFLPVLKWLAHNPELEAQARAQLGKEGAMFLWKHGDEDISLCLVIHKNTEQSFYSYKVENYGTVAGPICRFILDRLNNYAEAADKRDIIPLKVCACCPKIMCFERNSRKTCSDSCRVAKHRKGL
jgi:hypothetical protein